MDEGQTIKMDFKISTIKPLLCGWLNIAWQHVANNQDVIKKGWGQVRILRAFDSTFHI